MAEHDPQERWLEHAAFPERDEEFRGIATKQTDRPAAHIGGGPIPAFAKDEYGTRKHVGADEITAGPADCHQAATK